MIQFNWIDPLLFLVSKFHRAIGCLRFSRKSYIFDNMRTIHEIKSVLGEYRNHLFRSYPIKSMAIFGSYSREENSEDSDLDILVEFDDKIGIRFIDLADELEEIVGMKVDLVSRNGIKEGYFSAINPDLIYV